MHFNKKHHVPILDLFIQILLNFKCHCRDLFNNKVLFI